MQIKPLNLFYEEPSLDRWIKFDRYPRKIIRRLIRGKSRPGGVMMIALELMKGLDKLGIPYRFNDYKYAKKNPDELIGVIGKPHLIFEKKFKNPILFGAGTFSHPIDCPNFFQKYHNVKKILVPGDWMENMFEPYYGEKVAAWPTGIDTKKWNPSIKNNEISVDFLIYEKFLWDKSEKKTNILDPIIKILNNHKLTYNIVHYGNYTHKELINYLSISKAVIFLAEHETQGIAYQQILSTNTPILALNNTEYWIDPNYYPHLVKYKPVSSVPYWDSRCGLKFQNINEFSESLQNFLFKNLKNKFDPRAYIIENLTLEISAQKYFNLYKNLENNLLK